ncbi:transferase [Forsythia ovata]|uniref:GPI mannosyltransferase 2 n=1 Tax=Forsythia ovata TaxID=205694 RepID=A0ABD1X5R6_9LAMI
MLNNIAFVFAASYLHRLSLAVLKDPEVALRASILFCFNPASIFYSSIYSESLYALLSMGGLYYFMHGADNCATFLLALSGSARSNGVLSVGYICFRTMQQAYDALFLRKRAFSLLQVIFSGALRSLCIVVPFISFQAYGYLNICMGLSPDERRPWCKARLPLLYSYIQSHYWGVGFLRYFQVKQLPNFLLASPILSLALFSIIYYVKLWPEDQEQLVCQRKKLSNIRQDDSTLRQRKRAIKGEKSVALQSKSAAVDRLKCVPVAILPFVLHLSFMVATAFFVMHVQVATRFLSASPSLFWFASHIMGSSGSGKRWGHFIWAYCATYIFLGSLLFSNFYPFT